MILAPTRRCEPVPARPRVGLFGHLGACNIGNDASMEAIVDYLAAEHPETVVDAMCPGPATLRRRYGIEATPLFWQHRFQDRRFGYAVIPLKVIGKGIDAFRTARWVARHEVVIVPGAGVLEASLPLWPWGMPYALLLLSASGRLFGTKVALVSVGAGSIEKPVTRWLSNQAARWAFYRSYRDVGARDAMCHRGVAAAGDPVYPDLAFALPSPPEVAVDSRLVGVGVMAYRGSNDDRRHGDAIYSKYVADMKEFILWLIDGGRKVRLFVGDTNGSDKSVVDEIVAGLHGAREGIDPGSIVEEPVASFLDVMTAMAEVSSVVAIRYHNIVCSLKLAKPTISIGYSPKHDQLMSDMGLGEFCHDVKSLDIEQLKEQFLLLESRAPELCEELESRSRASTALLADQFRALSGILFSKAGHAQFAGIAASTPGEG